MVISDIGQITTFPGESAPKASYQTKLQIVGLLNHNICPASAFKCHFLSDAYAGQHI